MEFQKRTPVAIVFNVFVFRVVGGRIGAVGWRFKAPVTVEGKVESGAAQQLHNFLRRV